jgi:hypothetical protein
MASPDAEWVEERTLAGKGSAFAWRLDEAGSLVIRTRARGVIFARAGLERLQRFMADGAWHPASRATEAWTEGGSAPSIAGFAGEALGWGSNHVNRIGLVAAIFANSGAWAWDGRTRGLSFKQVDGGLDPLQAYYERRRRGEASPERRNRGMLRRQHEPPPFDLAATFRGLGKALSARLEVAETGRHPGDKGRRREGALRDFLREHLPPAFGVTQGEAVAAGGQASRQMDVLIYDALHAPVLLASDSSSLVAIESVYAGIEVKPSLSASTLMAAAENLASLKALPSSALMRPPVGYDPEKMPTRNPAAFGAVFAYESDPPIRLLDALCEVCKDRPPELWPEAIVVLDKAVIYRQGFRPAALGWSWQYARNRTPFLCVEAGANSLLFFYLMLLQDLNAKTLLPPDLMKYALTLGLPEPTVRRP